MPLRRALFALAATFLTATLALAGGDAVGLTTATGSVEKVEKDTLTVQSRGPDGRFGKKLVLKVTGTSKLSAVSQEKRGGKLVAVQRDLAAKDLEKGQPIAVVYTGEADAVLLSAVVQRPAPTK